MRNIFRMLFTGTLGLVSYALFVFVPAGTPNYWQAWVLLAVIATTGWVTALFPGKTPTKNIAIPNAART